MDNISVIKRLICLIALTFVSVSLWAGNMYQYRDDNDRIVLDDKVPKAFIHKVYKVINSQGYVIEVIPPAMTEVEKESFRKEALRQKSLKKLRKTYSEPADAELARDRQLSMIESQISVKKGVIARLTGQKKRETGKAANLERRGSKVHEPIVENIKRLDRQIAAAEADIAKREQEKEETRVRFEKDIQQLRKLLNMPAVPAKR